MGLLIEGQWHDQWYDTQESNGAFVRESAQLRHWITTNGDAGPTGRAGFKAESGRYHLYVSLACPWAHRTLIFRQLKGLVEHIGVSIVAPDMLAHGWTFDESGGSSGDGLFQSRYMHEIYTRNQPNYSGRVTVPVLWDTHTNAIVSNESADIIRMFNSAFNELTGNTFDYYPTALQTSINAINDRVYHNVNNGVYKAGFATQQAPYEEAVMALFTCLYELDARLATQRYLITDQAGNSHLTEADWRLFTTLIRFDPVYVGHFKCNLKRIVDYPHLAAYVRDLYQMPGIAETVDFYHIKRHYYASHATINPTGIVPVGPEMNYSQSSESSTKSSL